MNFDESFRWSLTVPKAKNFFQVLKCIELPWISEFDAFQLWQKSFFCRKNAESRRRQATKRREETRYAEKLKVPSWLWNPWRLWIWRVSECKKKNPGWCSVINIGYKMDWKWIKNWAKMDLKIAWELSKTKECENTKKYGKIGPKQTIINVQLLLNKSSRHCFWPFWISRRERPQFLRPKWPNLSKSFFTTSHKLFCFSKLFEAGFAEFLFTTALVYVVGSAGLQKTVEDRQVF